MTATQINSSAELLAPYRAVLQRISDKARGRITLAEALIRNEAAHVALIRSRVRAPQNGWKNKLPLEQATLVGRYIRGLRINDVQCTRDALDCDDTRKIADTLLNAEGVFVDHYNWRGMSIDQLIKQAAVDLYYY